VEKVLACIGRAEACQALAITAPSDHHKAEYLKLAQMWLELARTRREWLSEAGLYTSH
jgi:hypothetical protein